MPWFITKPYGCAEFCLVLCLCVSVEDVLANSGKKFLITFPQSRNVSGIAQILVALDTANGFTNDATVSLILKDPDEQLETALNASHPLVKLDVPRDHVFPKGTIKGHTYVIRLEASDMVVVTVRNGGGSNLDSYLALPITELGKTYFALTMNVAGKNAANFIVITAASQPTSVKFYLPKAYINAIEFIYDNKTFRNNDVVDIHLRSYEAIQFQFKEDVTGAVVESDFIISVWTGANRTSQNSSVLSHAIEQIPPINMAGKQFVSFPTCAFDNEDKFRYRVVSLYHSTTVQIHIASSQETNSSSYFLPRSGYVLELEIDWQESLAYIDANKPVSVYYISKGTQKMFDNMYGDVFTVWIPPVDMEMPSAITFPTNKAKNAKDTISFVIEADEIHGLFLNDVLVEELDGFNLTTLDIAGRPDLVGGCLWAPAKESDVLYEMKHLGGAGFVAAHIIKSPHEGEGRPLSYGLSRYDPEIDVVPEGDTCCLSVDSEGRALYPNECSNSAGPYDTDCCVVDHQKRSCQVQSAKRSCNLLNERKLSSIQTQIQASSLLDCHMSCASFNGCIGVNFDMDGPDSTSCELLSGLPMGYDGNSAGTMRHLNCVWNIEYALL